MAPKERRAKLADHAARCFNIKEENMKKLLLALSLTAVTATSGYAQDKVTLNMPSTFPGSLIQLGQAGVRLQDTLNQISGGEIEVKFFEPNALVPPLEIYDNVSNGSTNAITDNVPDASTKSIADNVSDTSTITITANTVSDDGSTNNPGTH